MAYLTLSSRSSRSASRAASVAFNYPKKVVVSTSANFRSKKNEKHLVQPQARITRNAKNTNDRTKGRSLPHSLPKLTPHYLPERPYSVYEHRRQTADWPSAGTTGFRVAQHGRGLPTFVVRTSEGQSTVQHWQCCGRLRRESAVPLETNTCQHTIKAASFNFSPTESYGLPTRVFFAIIAPYTVESTPIIMTNVLQQSHRFVDQDQDPSNLSSLMNVSLDSYECIQPPFPSEESFNHIFDLIRAHFLNKRPSTSTSVTPELSKDLVLSLSRALASICHFPVEKILPRIIRRLRAWRVLPREEKHSTQAFMILAVDLAGLADFLERPCSDLDDPRRLRIRWIGFHPLDATIDTHTKSSSELTPSYLKVDSAMPSPLSVLLIPRISNITQPDSAAYRSGCCACRQPRHSAVLGTSSTQPHHPSCPSSVEKPAFDRGSSHSAGIANVPDENVPLPDIVRSKTVKTPPYHMFASARPLSLLSRSDPLLLNDPWNSSGRSSSSVVPLRTAIPSNPKAQSASRLVANLKPTLCKASNASTAPSASKAIQPRPWPLPTSVPGPPTNLKAAKPSRLLASKGANLSSTRGRKKRVLGVRNAAD